MYNTKIYTCEISKNNSISYTMNNHIAIINFLSIDFQNIKLFFHLLRSSIEDIKQSYNIQFIHQHINPDEWHYFTTKKNSWKLISTSSHYYVIESIIDDSIENIAIGFGFDKLYY